MGVTQKQIAERLNISPSLVGRALNGHPEVAEKTRLRVEAVAKEMGYSLYTNSAARALIARRYGQKLKKGIIAVAFPPQELSSLRHTPFFASIIEGMEAEAARSGIEIYFCMLRENEVPVLVREQEVDGIVMLGRSETSVAVVGEAEKLGMPAVTVHWRCHNAYSVGPDDRAGARHATRYLLELGHRRIGFLGIQGVKTYQENGRLHTLNEGDIASSASIQRLQGYLDAMGEYGVEVQDEWIEDSLPLRSLAVAYCPGCGNCASCMGWRVLMDQNQKDDSPFTALVCHNDSVAMGAVMSARQDGLEVPRDLSVIGFDHISGEFNFQPELTSVNFPRSEMGRWAVQILKGAGKDITEPASDEAARHHVFPAELIVEASTQPPVETAADDIERVPVAVS